MSAPAAHRRPFAWRLQAAAGAVFTEVGDAAIADHYGAAEAEGEAARRLGLADLSTLPRTGYKGRDAIAWLDERGLAVPPQPNRAARQPDGLLVATLAATEALLLPEPFGPGRPDLGPEPPGRLCYAVPRRDGSLWFRITGSRAAEMFAKLCAIDLRPHHFAPLAIAQTSVARVSAIVIRDDADTVPAYHLLADSASAGHLWRCLTEAMADYGGRPFGLAGLRWLTRR